MRPCTYSSYILASLPELFIAPCIKAIKSWGVEFGNEASYVFIVAVFKRHTTVLILVLLCTHSDEWYFVGKIQ